MGLGEFCGVGCEVWGVRFEMWGEMWGVGFVVCVMGCEI